MIEFRLNGNPPRMPVHELRLSIMYALIPPMFREQRLPEICGTKDMIVPNLGLGYADYGPND